MIETFTHSTFAGRLGEKFRVRLGPADVVELELIQATDYSTPKNPRFSVLFRGPRNLLLPQQIYEIEHDELGTLPLFIVPVGVDKDGFQYEAIFNRVVQ